MTRPDALPANFEDVRAAYLEFYRQNGGQVDRQTAQDALMQLVASVGELATYCRGAPLDSEFEREELHDVVGSLTISLSIIADAFQVNPGEAALARIQRLQRRAQHGHMVSAVQPTSLPAAKSAAAYGTAQQRPPVRPSAVRPEYAQQQPHTNGPNNTFGSPSALVAARPRPLTIDVAEAEVTHDNPILSPNTTNSFFPMLDFVDRNMKPEDLENLNITWCVPFADGRVVDLIPDGRNQAVTPNRWKEFCNLARQFRPSATVSDVSVSQPTSAPPSATHYAQAAMALASGGGNSPNSNSRYSPPIAAQPGGTSPNGLRVSPTRPGPPAGAGPSGHGQGHVAPLQLQGDQDDVIVRQVNVHSSRPYDPSKEAKLFSPSHFQQDLFSPHSGAMSFEVPYHANQLTPQSKAEIMAATSSPSAGHEHTASLRQPPATVMLPLPAYYQTNQSGAPPQHESPARGSPGTVGSPPRPPVAPTLLPVSGAAAPPSPQAPTDQRTTAEHVFWERVELLKRHQAPVESLGLSFTVPHGGQWIELLEQGHAIKVTRLNAPQFLELLDEKMKEIGGRLRRSGSMRTLAVQGLATYDPEAVAKCFSPTHFQNNLFAPNSGQTVFTVDYERPMEILPPTLQHSKLTGCPNPMAYTQTIQGREDTFASILQEVLHDSSALGRFKVTWCVPDGDKLDDIVADGRWRQVMPSDLKNYLEAVFTRLPHLRPSSSSPRGWN